MAKPRRTKVLITVFLLVVQICHTRSEKVKVDLYMEGLCKSCRRYLKDIVYPLVGNGLIDWVDVRLIASGNAHMRDDGEIHCQHGDDECLMNAAVECAMSLSDDPKVWLPVVACLEADVEAALASENYVQYCADKGKFSAQDIIGCALGDKGEKLFEKAFHATQDLDVKHRWVPWLVVNNMPVYDSDIYLQQLICVTIPQDERPDVCKTNQFADGYIE
ncbi:hypothetical protein BSKO_04170 [Bryopsis sp. KO-2023]|nr:hypothetical protein BSKO_04170 [Bryopsis sp. KO-2023]